MDRARLIRWLTSRFSRELEADEVASCPAIVFAPHQDDETLIAGGVIALKRASGAPVTIVYMTDGAASKLKVEDVGALRRREALEACGALGVDGSNVVFLDFPDGRLQASADVAVRSVGDLLARHPGSELYLPWRDDGHPDHEVTARVVFQACARTGGEWTVFEAPVWFWYQYPIAVVPGLGLKGRVRELGRLFRELVLAKTVKVDVGAWREIRKAALDAHRSQMTRAYGLEEGALPEIADGAWLACLTGRWEVFRQSRVKDL